MVELGDRIRLMLERNEITQKDFAKKIDVTPTALSNYIQNTRSPSLDIVVKMCSELHCTADYLLGRSEEPILRLTSEESSVIRAWRKIDDQDLKDLIKRNLGIFEKKKQAV